MPVTSFADFLDAVRLCRLLEPAQLDELGQFQAAFPEPRALAGELIRRGWLTAYQVNQLMQGRGQRLLLGSYILMDRLGEGGMGEVFKARNWKLGRVVALKLIRKERIDNPDAVRRFQREIRAAAQLDHPHIVRAFDADEVGGAHLLVMEYVQGTDLAKLVKQNGPLPIDKACDTMRQAALGLQHACERGMVHRDIKPQNLLVTPAGVVKILDMGLARIHKAKDDESSATMTREGTVMGTLDYISPEQAMDSHDVDIRADLYSLGCTLYFLLTGKVPFPGGEALQKLLKHRLEEPIPVERLRPDVPPSVAAVVRKLMAKQPDDRYQTPADAAAALTSALDHESQTGELAASVSATQVTDANGDASGWSSLVAAQSKESPPPPRRPRPPLRIQPAVLVGAAVGAIVLGLGLVGLFRLLPREPRPATSPIRPAVAAIDKEIPKASALSPSEQVARLVGELKRLNPGFDGTVKPTIKDGVVTGLEFLTDNVTDISPVRALTGLNRLKCQGSEKSRSRLSDLSPLKPMRLTALFLDFTSVVDLGPLSGLPLKELRCNDTPLEDLRPLKGLPLAVLRCDGTRVSDLSPLKDMALLELWCNETRVTDLSPLQKMPLTVLGFNQTDVSDLSPLQGMPLRLLGCDRTRVTDLSPLKGMRLTTLYCYQTDLSDLSPIKDLKLTYINCSNTKVTDLSPLKDMPLTEIVCDFVPERDARILRSIKTLETINDKPAADFWKAVDARTVFEAWRKHVAALSAGDQVRAVAAKLKELNPGFDGKETHNIIEGRVVAELTFLTDNVTDLSPVRALTGLKMLRCIGSAPRKGGITDLSALAGVPLNHLDCNNNKISDLAPLKGTSLRELHCNGNQISNLGPLTGMELTFLNCGGNPIADLTPLAGMPLETLWCHYTEAPNLEPLRGMPLKQLLCDFHRNRDAGVLHSLKTLERINGKPAADFWKEVDKRQAAFEAWCKEVAALPVEKQWPAVAEELKRRNPGFDGTVKPTIEDGVVTGLEFLTDNVTDISPVRALPGLRGLNCSGTWPLGGRLADLSPLKDMKLTYLSCHHTSVSDLSPLKDTKLTLLYCDHTLVSDLSPLRGMPLEELQCDFNPNRDAAILRSIPTLQKINGKPAADFWKEVDSPTAVEAWPKQVAAMSWSKQVEAVAARLKEVNPGFDGTLKPTIEDDVVTGLECTTDNLTDLSPVCALKGLKSLHCAGSGWSKGGLSSLSSLKGAALANLNCSNNKLSDLAPLMGMPLKDLNCNGNQISKLKPLAGMELTSLDCGGNPLADLWPLKGMPLKMLFCHYTSVSDLTPLKGMNLGKLFCRHTAVTDLSPLRDVRLTYLNCSDTAVSDLAPLKDAKLTALDCNDTKISDLSPLKGMQLTYLSCEHTRVSDLAPLRGMPLKHISCDFDAKRDASILRSIETLEKINDQPAADFWKTVGDAPPKP